MLVRIYTSWPKGGGIDGPTPKKLFEGNMDCIPTVGDLIVVREGYGAESIMSVVYDAPENSVEITLCTDDPRNEYPAVK